MKMVTVKKWFLRVLNVITNISEMLFIGFLVVSALSYCLCFWLFEYVMK